eukprot:COSAG06_NODE_3703_length_4995_cov_3.609273_3_plen_91_part_00
MRQALDEVCAGGKLPRLAGARALRASRAGSGSAAVLTSPQHDPGPAATPRTAADTKTRQKTDPAVNSTLASSAENSRQLSGETVSRLYCL